MQVIPSIDVEKIADLQEQLPRLIPFYSRFQIDYADGKFVNFTTPPVLDLIESLVPYATIQFDIHLMTLGYQRALDLIRHHGKRLKLGVIFVHHSAKPSLEMFFEKRMPYKFGLVLNPEDEITTIHRHYDLPDIENIQIMTIVPGPQGNPFLPNMLNKIEQLRLAGYKNKIFLDGGVNEESLKLILAQKFQPDFICPGSYFSKAEDVGQRVKALSRITG